MYWLRFNEHCAHRSNRGQFRTAPGIQSIWAHTALLIHNRTIPAAPIENAEGLAQAARSAVADAAPYALPWMFGIPEPWLRIPLDEANEALAPAGLHYQMYMTVMECPGPLLGPHRPLPADVRIQRVTSRHHTLYVLKLNCLAYGMPVEIADDVLASDAYFTDPANTSLA